MAVAKVSGDVVSGVGQRWSRRRSVGRRGSPGLRLRNALENPSYRPTFDFGGWGVGVRCISFAHVIPRVLFRVISGCSGDGVSEMCDIREWALLRGVRGAA